MHLLKQLTMWAASIGGAAGALWKGRPAWLWTRARWRRRRRRWEQLLSILEDVNAVVTICEQLLANSAQHGEWRDRVESKVREYFEETDRELHTLGRRIRALEAAMKEYAR